MREEPLTGGNVTAGVVRVGDTVRRPAGPWTPAVHALLTHLADSGFTACPKSYGLDERGRHVLEWIEGAAPHPFAPVSALSPSIREIGRTIRAFHDAVRSFQPPPDAVWGAIVEPDARDLIIHNDLSSWNFVHGARQFAFIDWDLAGPGSALWDLALAAHGFAGVGTQSPIDEIGTKLRDLADGYDLDQPGRIKFADLMPARYRAMHDLLARGARTGAEPWARMWREGHGEIWRAITETAEAQATALRAAMLA